MSLDLFERETEERYDRMTPLERPESGAWDGFLRGSAQHAMQGFAKAARSLSLAGAVFPIAYDKFTDGTQAQDRYFRDIHEATFQNAVDHWTPKPGEVGWAGQVTGTLLSLLPLVVASPTLAVTTTQLSMAEDLIKKGVDPVKAQAVGAAYGLGIGLGIWVPILGQTLPQRMLLGGAGFNTAQGIAMRGTAGAILEGTPAAGEFRAFAPEDLTLDVLLGLAFGGLAHLSPAMRAQGDEFWQRVEAWRHNLSPEQIGALSVLRAAQHASADSLPGLPASPESVEAHVARVRAGVEQLATDQPVHVTDLPAAEVTPDIPRMEEAQTRAQELVQTAETVRQEEGLPPPPSDVPRGAFDLTGVPAEEQPRAIATAVEQALTRANVAPEEARAGATLWEHFFRTAAQRYSIPAGKILEQYGLNIRRLGEMEDLPGALEQVRRAQIESAAFKQWFSESKVVDESGQPLIVYHGTEASFATFRTDKANITNMWGEGHGFFFTRSPEQASKFATGYRGASWATPNVMPVYLSLKNPIHIDFGPEAGAYGHGGRFSARALDDALGAAKKAGHDGAIIENLDDYGGRHTQYIAFRPEQVKSAVGNRGTFDPSNPNILFQPLLKTLDQVRRGVFYSELGARVDEVKQETASPEQWKGMLKNMRGVKRDELQWTGLEEWLDLQQGRVTKQQVRDFLAGNAVRVEEVVLGRGDMTQAESEAATQRHTRAQNKASETQAMADRLWQDIETAIPPIRGVDRANLPWWGREMAGLDTGDPAVAEAKARAAGIAEPQIQMLREWGSVQNEARQLQTAADALDPTRAHTDPLTAITDRLSNLGWSRGDGDDAGTFIAEDGPLRGIPMSLAEMLADDRVPQNVRDAAEQLTEAEARSPAARERPTKFATYQLPGGENYRELLITLPEQMRGAIRLEPTKSLWTESTKDLNLTSRGGESGPTKVWTAEIDGQEYTIMRLDNRAGTDRAYVLDGGRGSIQNAGSGSLEAAMIRAEYGRKYPDLLVVREPAAALRGEFVPRRDAGRFTSSHFDEPNVLAHVRFNERVDADGKRVLFVEEFQSDWAQRGKREGFEGEKRDSRYREILAHAERLERAGRQLEYDAVREGERELTEAESAQYADLNRRAAELRAEAMRLPAISGKVPSAPFVGKTEAWVGLSMKRMISWAVENGFDRVAWTRGEQQVERYTGALRKAVDEIQWKKTEQGVQLVGYKGKGGGGLLHVTDSPRDVRIRAEQALDRNDNLGFDSTLEALQAIAQNRGDWTNRWDVPEATDRAAIEAHVDTMMRRLEGRTKVVDTTQKEDVLSDTIGKAMAKRILDDPAESGTITGENIKIDDPGMAAFYDRMIPNIANDILKKVGGAKVRDINIEMGKEFQFEGQQGFDITPEMRERVPKGLPLFQQGRGQIQFGDGQTVIGLFENADRSTFLHETGHFFLQVTRDLASRAAAPEAAMQDWATLAKWLKVEGGQIPVEAHEKFARGFEAYLREGKAPSEGLKAVFEQFKQWLLSVYHSLTDLNVTLSDDVRAVMDRMLAPSKADGPAGQTRVAGFPPPPRTQAQPAGSAAPKMSPLMRDVKALGGIDQALMEEVTGERLFGKVKGLPWGVFKKRQANMAGQPTAGLGLDDMARQLRERGWAIPEENEVAVLTKLLDDEIRGAKATRMGEEAEMMTSAQMMREMDDLHGQFTQAEADAAEQFGFRANDPGYLAEIERIRAQRDQAMAALMQEAENPLQAEAARVAREKPNLKIRVGEDAEGKPVTKSVRQYLEEASDSTERAINDSKLFDVAAACIRGRG